MKIKIIFCFITSLTLGILFIFMINNRDNYEKTTLLTQLKLQTSKNLKNKNISCYYDPAIPSFFKLINEEDNAFSSHNTPVFIHVVHSDKERRAIIVKKMKIKVGFYIMCGTCLCITLFLIISNIEIRKFRKKQDITCYFDRHVSDSAKLLMETELTEPSKIGNHIFFLETSCPEDGELVLNPRQACAIESAAKMNPEMEIYVLMLSPANFSNKTKNLINHLKTYKNINIRRVFMDNYVKNTPLEKWWKSGVFQTSRWPREHMADVMRFLTLWKFPGIYFDLDVVIMSSLKNLTDFAGAEDSEVVAIGALGFGSKPISRRIVTEYLEDLAENFRGDLWRHNGPDILTKVLQTICGTQNTLEMAKERCEGFTVYPPHIFYPIHYNSWWRYFENTDKHTTIKMIQDATIIHVWNKLSYMKEIQVGDDVPYALIANQYCPKIYHNCGPIF